MDALPHNFSNPLWRATAAAGGGVALSLIRHWRPAARCANWLALNAALRGNVPAVMDLALSAVTDLKLELKWPNTYFVEFEGSKERFYAASQSQTTSPRDDASLTKSAEKTKQNWPKRIWKYLHEAFIWFEDARDRKRANAVVGMLRRVPESDSQHWGTAQYYLGLFHLRGPLDTDVATAGVHLENAYRAGHMEAGAELALAQIRCGQDKKLAGQILSRVLPSLSEGKLRSIVELEIARFEIIGITGVTRNLSLAKELTLSLLEMSPGDIGASESTFEYGDYTKQMLKREAMSLFSLADVELISENRRIEERRARDQLYSFITHSIPSAMSSVVGQTESSLGILSGHSPTREADRDVLIRHLSGALGRAQFINSLMATHKLLIAGKDRLGAAWLEEQGESIVEPKNLLLDAAKQALAQTLFTDRNFEQLDLAELDDQAIDSFRTISVDELSRKTAAENDCIRFQRYVSEHVPFLRFIMDDGIEWRAAPNGIRRGVMQSAITELIRNALKHRLSGTPLTVRLGRTQNGFCISIANEYDASKASALGGTKRGLSFVAEFCEAIESLKFSTEQRAGVHVARLAVAGD